MPTAALKGSEIGEARIGYNGRAYVCPVVFGPEDKYVLGAIALESFRLVVDPLRKELVPASFVVRPFNRECKTTLYLGQHTLGSSF